MNNLHVVTLIAVILFLAAILGIVFFWWTAPVPAVRTAPAGGIATTSATL